MTARHTQRLPRDSEGREFSEGKDGAVEGLRAGWRFSQRRRDLN